MTVPKTSQKGMMNLIELLLVGGIILIFTSVATLYLRPVKNQRKARDTVRISDLTVLARGIEEYNLDNSSLPDSNNTTRTSDALPTGNSGPNESLTEGWIAANFSGYLLKLPLDPTNTDPYVYTYRRSGTAYELNAVLEESTEEMVADGGDNDDVYEIGSSLTIIN